MNGISPEEVKKMIACKDEFALLDVREEGAFSKGHLLFATCMPFGRMEMMVRDFVPRYDTPIILTDGGGSDRLQASEQAASRLERFGYRRIAVMRGGVLGWSEAGFEVFTGVNVLSKAFGEFVERTYHTPNITPEMLKSKIDRGENVVVLDSRPWDEYRSMHIPGAIDTPGAELVYRVHDLAPDPGTLVVVNCAGRTRSIIGAQSLINAGVENSVVALRNGTMGWLLAGYELERGDGRFAPLPSPAGLERAKVRTGRVAERFGVKLVDHATLSEWARQVDDRTLYVLDVRQAEAFDASHLGGSRNTPGGQLIQATDEHVAVRNARVVLVDDTEVHATMTASWLVQMGWEEVYVLEGGIGLADRVRGPHMPEIPCLEKGFTMTCTELKAMIDAGARVAIVDLASSVEHWQNHIPGSWWGLRSGLLKDLFLLSDAERIVLTSWDGKMAHLAYHDMKSHMQGISLCVLDGGTEAWVKGGLPTATGIDRTISRTEDVWIKPYESEQTKEEFMRDYLRWETALPAQIKRDGDAHFRTFD